MRVIVKIRGVHNEMVSSTSKNATIIFMKNKGKLRSPDKPLIFSQAIYININVSVLNKTAANSYISINLRFNGFTFVI